MGGKAPPDNSDKVAAIEAQAAREARQAAEAKAAQERADFDQRLTSSYSSGLDSARQYFASRGLNPDDYIGSITNAANRAKGQVPILDSSPGTYFQDLGAQVWGQERDNLRAQQLRAINSMFGNNYAETRVSNDLDDATINGILGECQSEAERYVQNLVDRGVITGSGAAAALKNVQGQKATANARLDEIGRGLLEGGRTNLNKIINDGRSSASALDLGDSFDPYSYQGRADNEFTDFISGLGDRLRAASPTDLFSTSGLAGVAGAAQGAQNTKFDPNALAGIFDDEEDNGNGGDSSTNPF